MRIALAALLIALALPLAACDSGNDAPPTVSTDGFTIVTPQPYSLAAERDSLVVDLTRLLRSRTNLPVTFSLVEAPTGARIQDQQLRVAPQPVGSTEIRVRGIAGENSAEVAIKATFEADQISVLTVATPTARANVDTVKVVLATLLKSKFDLPIAYTVVSGPAGAQIVNGRLIVPPQPVGQAHVTVRGTTQTATGESTVNATFVPNTIAVTRTLPGYDLRARGDSVVVDLPTVFRGPVPGPPLAYAVVAGMSEAFVRGTQLIVKPENAGTFNVRLRASMPGTPDAETSFRLSATGDWCATPPSGTVDPIPFQPGESVRFSLRIQGYSVPGNIYRRSSTLTWNILRRTCAFGEVNLDFTEHEAGTDTTQAGMVSAVNETRRYSVSIPVQGTLPNMGAYVFGGYVRRFLPIENDGIGRYNYATGVCSGSGGGRVCFGVGFLAEATAQGLALQTGLYDQRTFRIARLP